MAIKVIVTHPGDIKSVAGQVAAHLGCDVADVLELPHGAAVSVYDVQDQGPGGIYSDTPAKDSE